MSEGKRCYSTVSDAAHPGFEICNIAHTYTTNATDDLFNHTLQVVILASTNLLSMSQPIWLAVAAEQGRCILFHCWDMYDQRSVGTTSPHQTMLVIDAAKWMAWNVKGGGTSNSNGQSWGKCISTRLAGYKPRTVWH